MKATKSFGSAGSDSNLLASPSPRVYIEKLLPKAALYVSRSAGRPAAHAQKNVGCGHSLLEGGSSHSRTKIQ